MGSYICRVTLFAICNTIQKAVVMVAMGNYIRRVIVIGGSLYSQVYGMHLSVSNYSPWSLSQCDKNLHQNS